MPKRCLAFLLLSAFLFAASASSFAVPVTITVPSGTQLTNLIADFKNNARPPITVPINTPHSKDVTLIARDVASVKTIKDLSGKIIGYCTKSVDDALTQDHNGSGGSFYLYLMDLGKSPSGKEKVAIVFIPTGTENEFQAASVDAAFDKPPHTPLPTAGIDALQNGKSQLYLCFYGWIFIYFIS